jgi:hypothetical protein
VAFFFPRAVAEHENLRQPFFVIRPSATLRQAQEDKGKKGATKALRHKDDFCEIKVLRQAQEDKGKKGATKAQRL